MLFNGKEIAVKFGVELDKTSAESATYAVTVSAGSAFDTTPTAKLAADKKTVILSSATPFANGDTFKVDVKDVLSKDYNLVPEYKGTTTIFNDTTAPTLVSAAVDATDLVLNFSEPVDVAADVYIDGTRVATTLVDASAPGKYTYKVAKSTITGVSASLLSAGTHTVTVYDVEDSLATPNETVMTSGTFTVTADTTAPVVEGITALSSNSFKIKVSEELSSLTAANLVVKKGNYTFPSGVSVGTYNAVDSTYTVTVVAPDATNNPLYDANANSVALSVTVKNFKDLSDLFGTQFDGSVTLTKDTAAPALGAATLNYADTQYLYVKFNEDIANAVQSKVVVKKDNVVQTVSGVSVVQGKGAAGTTSYLRIDLGAGNVKFGDYVIELAAGAVEDLETPANKNAAVSLTLKNEGAVSNIDLTNGDITVLAGNVIKIDYSNDVTTEEMGDSAAVLANYKWNGGSFPVGTQIAFVGDKSTVHITLPDNYFTSDTTGVVTVTSNVKTKSGVPVYKVATTKTENTFQFGATAIKDNVKPTLTGAKFLVANNTAASSNKIKLTFSENLAAVADNPATIADFAVKVNGVKQTISNITDGTAYDNTVVITLGGSVVLSQPVTVETVAEGALNTTVDVTDNTSASTKNKLVSGTNLSITEKEVDPNITNPNTAPVVASAIANQTGVVGTNTTVSLSGVFTDANSDTLSYTVTSSSAAVATVTVGGGNVVVAPVSEGTATITVTADDGHGGTVSDSFDIVVSPAPLTLSSAPALAMSGTTQGAITGVTAGTGETLEVTSATPAVLTVDDVAALDVTAVSAGTSVVTVKVKNAAGNVIKQGTVTVTVGS